MVTCPAFTVIYLLQVNMKNKLIKRKQIPWWLVFILLTANFYTIYAQDSITSKPPVTHKWKDYKKQVKADDTKKMVELKTKIPAIVYDLRYATTNNFMNRLMYPENTTVTFLRIPAADALANVQQELNALGLGLKIFDAYRPYSVTVKFWELVKDERYVANPAKGSGHNRGIAVDLTIIDLKTGKELNMGTGFDNFTDTAHHIFTSLPEEILHNRLLLKTTMEKHGFIALESEWWHYYLVNGNRFELLDIDFKKLKKNF
jgi:D-alanyl-D-alanine dipeptidase